MAAIVMHLSNGHDRSENYYGLLKNSMRYFLSKYPESVFRLSDLISEFNGIILDLEEPPLEIVLFYGAIAYHNCNPNVLSPQAKLIFASELFEFLNSCLNSSNVVKKVAMIAPVLYILYHLYHNFLSRDPSFRKEIENIVEKLVSHINICCAQCIDETNPMIDCLGAYILDLVRVWTVDLVEIRNKGNVLASFFPILDNEFQEEVTMSMGYLVGIVMNEALLLRLCLKISPGVDKEVLQQDMLNLAIQTIKGFQNFYFLDMLLKMLLEPSLSVAASLSSDDAVLLRKALYDAVILVNYSFYPGRWAHSDSITHPKNLSLVWLLAADRAIQFARSITDEERAGAYLNAYHHSQMVTELIKWVDSQIGTVHPRNRPEISTPRDLINWLLSLEDHGLRVFDHSMSLLCAKALSCLENEPPQVSPNQSRFDLNVLPCVEYEPPQVSLQTENLNQSRFDLNVCIHEDQDMDDELINGLPGDPCLNMEKNGGKKRKVALSGAGELPNKQIKLDLFGYTI